MVFLFNVWSCPKLFSVSSYPDLIGDHRLLSHTEVTFLCTFTRVDTFWTMDWFSYHGYRPFPSSLVPLFQSESKCETIVMKMTLICMRMNLHAELIFIWKVSHLDSFWNRGTRELGNGLLVKLDFNRTCKRGRSWKSSSNPDIVLYILFLRARHKSNVWNSETMIKIVNLFGFQVEEEEWETTTIGHRCEATGTRLNLRKSQGMKCCILYPLAR